MDIDWNSLTFSYMKTNCHIRYTWKDGQWDAGVLHEGDHINIHIAATVLHYGQAAFEGLKAFSCKDGKVRVFRLDENGKRMNSSSQRIMMPEVPAAMFEEAVLKVVAANTEFVPPYGTGGSMYIRPLIFGSGPTIGVNPSQEYTFIVMVMPVGDYYKGGIKPVSSIVIDGFDRAAPHGVGHVKVAGNYAADMLPNTKAKNMGYPINLYLDAQTRTYVEEFGTSNFIAITNDNKYVTPDSPSILPSITNKTLMALAEDMGLTVERRPVRFDEISSFAELAACGTAVVITPVNHIIKGDEEIHVGPKDECGPTFMKLYKRVRGIQTGELEDIFGWCTDV